MPVKKSRLDTNKRSLRRTQAEESAIRSRHRRQEEEAAKPAFMADRVDKEGEKHLYVAEEISRIIHLPHQIAFVINLMNKKGYEYIDFINAGEHSHLLFKRISIEEGDKTSFVNNLINLNNGPGKLTKKSKSKKNSGSKQKKDRSKNKSKKSRGKKSSAKSK